MLKPLKLFIVSTLLILISSLISDDVPEMFERLKDEYASAMSGG